MSQSIISIYNTTSTPLGIRESFIGTGEKCLDFKNIGINVTASNLSSPDGLKIQFSSDNINWDITHSFTISAIKGVYFNLPVEAEYFRIIYTNGVESQTYFRLQTIMHLEMTKESTIRLGETANPELAASLVRSIITGKLPSGHYSNVRLTETGNINAEITGNIVEIFNKILLELRKVNTYLSIVTGEEIKEYDIEEEEYI